MPTKKETAMSCVGPELRTVLQPALGEGCTCEQYVTVAKALDALDAPSPNALCDLVERALLQSPHELFFPLTTGQSSSMMEALCALPALRPTLHRILLQYLVTLDAEEEPRLFHAVWHVLLHLGPHSSRESYKDTYQIANIAIRPYLIEGAPILVHTNGDSTEQKALIQWVEFLWSPTDSVIQQAIVKARLAFGVEVENTQFWSTRIIHILPAVRNFALFNCLVRFSLWSCASSEQLGKAFENLCHYANLDHLQLAICPSAPLSSHDPPLKRARQMERDPEESDSLSYFQATLMGKRMVEAKMRELLARPSAATSPLLLLFALALWDVPHYRGFLLGCMRKWSARAFPSADDAQSERAVMSAVRVAASLCNDSNVICSMAYDAAKIGCHQMAKSLLMSILRCGDVVERNPRELIGELVLMVLEAKTCEWSLQMIEGMSISHPEVMLRCQMTLRSLLDHLDRLKPEQIRSFYRSLLQVSLNGDASVWNEMQLVLRKQIVSVDPQIRLYGVCGFLGLLDVIFGKDHNTHHQQQDSEEATCSQMTRPKESRHGDVLLGLFELAMSVENFDLVSVNWLCRHLVPSLPHLDLSLVSRINKKVSFIFQDLFVFELQHAKEIISSAPSSPCHRPQLSLDGDDALIGACFTEKLLARKLSPLLAQAMPSIFELLQMSERTLHDGALDNIDALLGCPILMASSEEIDVLEGEDLEGCFASVLIAVNFIRSLLNAFCDQQDKEVAAKCLVRLDQLAELSGTLERLFAQLVKVPTRILLVKDGTLHFNIQNLYHTPPSNQLEQIDASVMEGESLHGLLEELGKDCTVEGNSEDLKPIKGKIKPAMLDQLLTPLTAQPLLILAELKEIKEGTCELLLRSLIKLDKLDGLGREGLMRLLEALTSRLIMQSGPIALLCDAILKLVNDAGPLSDAARLIGGLPRERLSWDRIAVPEIILMLLQVGKTLAMADDWTLSAAERALDLVLCKETSIIQASNILEHLSKSPYISNEMVDRLSRTFFEERPIEGKSTVLYQFACRICGQLQGADFDLDLKLAKHFDRLVQHARNSNLTVYTEHLLREGRVFLEQFQKEVIPTMRRTFLSKKNSIIELLKALQQSTRSLQIICNHHKAESKGKIRHLLPPMRKALEGIVYRVKQVLQANGCLTAFWIGNLKHRAIDGTETGSQISLQSDDGDMERGKDGMEEEEQEQEEEEESTIASEECASQ